MSTSTVSNQSVSTINGYAVCAAVELGSNGDSAGEPEYRVGTSATNYSAGRRVWDSDLSDGLQSGQVSVSLTANPGGGSNGVAWTVPGGGTVPLYYSNASYGAVSEVKVVAGVRVSGAAVVIGSVVARFYKNGSLVETITGGAVIADTEDFSSDTQEQILTITPSAADNTKVVVDCTISLRLLAEGVGNPDDLFARIFVFSA